MKNSIAGALVAIPLVAADLLAAGCGGGDDAGELTLKDYFVGLEVLLDDLAGSVDDDEIFAETDKSASVEEQGESLAGVYASFAEHTVGFSDGLAALQPPPEAQAAHEELLSESKAFTEDSEEVVGLLNDATSEADIQEAFEILDSAANLAAACNALQDVAEENDIVVSLNCALE